MIIIVLIVLSLLGIVPVWFTLMCVVLDTIICSAAGL